jgi:hypothetical protein
VGAEQERVSSLGHLEDGLRQAGDWYRWVRMSASGSGDGPRGLQPRRGGLGLLSARPREVARLALGEDALAGFCDIEQRLCLGLALWNGADPILKERPFGLTGPQGNHGEDVKEYWWYLDATPTHSWNR